jgi:RimJ/RimL family protein N-acetyltransferase
VKHDIELVADGMLLRPFQQGDAADVAFLQHVAADPVSWQWSPGLRAIHDQATAADWIEQRLAAAGGYEWLTLDSSTGLPLGRVGLHRHSGLGLEIGYWTAPEARGHGVARRGARAVTEFAHNILGEQRVVLLHAAANLASCRVAHAAAFPSEGTLRQWLDHGDGILFDAHLHARIAGDPWDPIPLPLLPGAPTELIGHGIVLRQWSVENAPALVRAAADPMLARWNPLIVQTVSEALTWIDRSNSWISAAAWAIHDDTTGELLGNIALHQLDSNNGSAEVGYWTFPEARGRGVAAHALQTATTFAFSSLKVERIELFHAVENSASCRVAEKTGYLLEGVARRSYRYGDGQVHDEHSHARLATDQWVPIPA